MASHLALQERIAQRQRQDNVQTYGMIALYYYFTGNLDEANHFVARTRAAGHRNFVLPAGPAPPQIPPDRLAIADQHFRAGLGRTNEE